MSSALATRSCRLTARELKGRRFSDAVFLATAAIQVNKDDRGECFLLSGSRAKSPEEIAKAKAEWLAEGYDPEIPRIDARFLGAVRAAIKQRS